MHSLHIQSTIANCKSIFEPAKKIRVNRYPSQTIPKTIRKPEEFLKAGTHLFETLAQGNGATVSFKTKGKCNARYANIWIYFLKLKKLLIETAGFYYHAKDWAYKKLTPTSSLSHALRSCRPNNMVPRLTGDTFLDALNSFYHDQDWKGCSQPVVRRSKDHGRIYTGGANCYLLQPVSERVKIKVNNKEMVELDISGSHLTALIGMHRGLFDHSEIGDPYAIGSFLRGDVKGAFKILLGSTKHGTAEPATSWFQDPQYKTRKVLYYGDCKAVSAALTKRYPFLKHLKQGTHNQLMQRESNVIVRVMQKLMQRDIVSLSMHDGLIVEADASEKAKMLLEHEYENEFRIKPQIKLKTIIKSDASEEDNEKPVNIIEIKAWILKQVGMSATFSSLTNCNRLSEGRRQGHSSETHKLEKVAHGGARKGCGRRKTEPWLALGISKDKYYRDRRNGNIK